MKSINISKEAAVALDGSIQKWEGIVAGELADMGSSNCPLCHEFWSLKCDGCPIKLATAAKYCEGTPYEDWGDLEVSWYFANSPDKVEVAQRMLNFLIVVKKECVVNE